MDLFGDTEDPEEAANICEWLSNKARKNPAKLADAGALEAIVKTMKRHPSHAKVQEHGSWALARLSLGTDEEGVRRQQRAADAGALETIVSAMQQHRDQVEVHEKGSLAIGNICFGNKPGEGADGRKQLAVDAGALEVLVEGMVEHSGSEQLQDNVSYAVGILCAGSDAEGVGRRQRAVEAGVLEPLVAAMQRHPNNDNVQGYCIRALRRCCGVAGPVRLQQLTKPLTEMLRRAKHPKHHVHQDAEGILAIAGASESQSASAHASSRTCSRWT